MERVRGRMLKGDEVILEGLDITLNVREPVGRLKQWGGSLQMNLAVHIEVLACAFYCCRIPQLRSAAALIEKRDE